MKDRDVLIRALAGHASRLRLTMLLRELSRMVCAILGALVLYQILAAAITASAVVNALGVLLVLLLISALIFFFVRGLSPIPLDEVAAIADAHANLKDELKTGYCLAQLGTVSPLVDLQIQRSARRAQRLNPRNVFPLIIPRGVFAAAGLAIAAVLLTQFAPQARYARSPSADSIAAAATTASRVSKPRTVSDDAAQSAEPPDARQGTQMSAMREGGAKWAKIETAVQGFVQGDELKALTAAIKQHDAGRVAQLLEEFRAKREFERAQSSVRGAPGADRATPDLLARLQELFSPGGNVPQSALDADAGEQLAQALDLAQKLDDDMRASGRNNPASHALEEGTNPLQAAVPLERFGPREARRSQGQGGEFAGTTDVEGGAMGRRVTQSNVGAGGKPSASETSNSDSIAAEQVMGPHTVRLAAQLKQVKIEGNHLRGSDAGEVADTTYAATRAQPAQSAYQEVRQHAAYVSESATGGDRVPLAYRGAVKDYFLDLDRNEP
ncbi:MAG: hypothetical protein ACJ8G2_10360 [Burkholderiales bacterium]